MKQVKTIFIFSALIVTLTNFSHAEGIKRTLTTHTNPPVSELETIASNYFDGNWKLFSVSEPSQPIADNKSNSSNSTKSLEKIATEYFNANWAVFQNN